MTEPVICTARGTVRYLTLNNPPLNPIGSTQVAVLEQHLHELAVDPAVHCIVIRGDGEHFSVGANLKETALAQEVGARAFIARRVALFDAIEAFEKPVIAAIRGYCLGGGLELAMACHLRIAHADAQLALPEIDLGVAPMWGGASRLLRLAGRAAALEMLLRGHRISAAEALTTGLINTVAGDDFDTVVNTRADELAAKAPLAAAAIIRVINQTSDLPLAKALEYELDQCSALAGTEDNIEGVTALFEKRQPRFIGR